MRLKSYRIPGFLPTTLTVSSLCVLMAQSAMAQGLPGSGQPGRAEDQIERTAPARRDVAPTPQVQQPATGPEAAARNVSFTLNNVTVEGSTVYLPSDLQTYYRPLLGQRVTLAQVQDVAAQLTRKYREDGYVLSQVIVPQQNIADGNVRLLAIEGYISEVVFQPGKRPRDARTADSTKLRAMADELRRSRPLTQKVLERQLLLMNSLPGVTARGVVRASKNTPGAADMFVDINTDRVSGFAQIDNRGSRYYGPVEVIGSVNVNQIFDEADSIRLRAATTYQTRELVYGEAHYQRMLNSNGTFIDLAASQAETNPGGNLAPLDIEGTDRNLRAQLVHPLIKSRNTNVNVYTTFDHHDVDADLQNAFFYEDKIRTLRAGTVWSQRDEYLGSAVNTVTFEASKGLDIMGATQRGDDSSRPAADANSFKLNASLSRAQNLRGSNVSLYGALTGQYAFNPMFATEEFGLGGEAFGSAYDPSELTGDSGMAARLEVRYDLPVDVNADRNILTQAQPYVFYDIGKVYNRDPLVGQQTEESLASAGAGIRLFAKNGYAASLEVAKPLTNTVAAIGESDSVRAFFKLSKSF